MNINSMDSRIFWIGLYVHPLVWIFLTFTALIRWSFEWLLIIAVSIVLGATNTILYTKCKKDSRKNLASFFMQKAFQMGASVGGNNLV